MALRMNKPYRATQHYVPIRLTAEQRADMTEIFAGFHGNMQKVYNALTKALIKLGKADRTKLMVAAVTSVVRPEVFQIVLDIPTDPHVEEEAVIEPEPSTEA